MPKIPKERFAKRKKENHQILQQPKNGLNLHINLAGNQKDKKKIHLLQFQNLAKAML